MLECAAALIFEWRVAVIHSVLDPIRHRGDDGFERVEWDRTIGLL
jgi:hypothetical protein